MDILCKSYAPQKLTYQVTTSRFTKLFTLHILLVHHISIYFKYNQSIGQREKQSIVSSTKWSTSLPKCMAILQQIDGTRVNEDRRVEGRIGVTSCLFSGNHWTTDSCMSTTDNCMWTVFSLVYKVV